MDTTRAASALVWALWLEEARLNGVERRQVASRLGLSRRVLHIWTCIGVPEERWPAIDDLPNFWMGSSGRDFGACVAAVADLLQAAEESP